MRINIPFLVNFYRLVYISIGKIGAKVGNSNLQPMFRGRRSVETKMHVIPVTPRLKFTQDACQFRSNRA